MDYDISCALAPNPEPVFGGFDWSTCYIKHSRLLSRIYASLYSVSASGKSATFYKATLEQLKKELEAWRLSIPPHLRPSEGLRPNVLPSPQILTICIMVNYDYYFAKLALLRTAIVLDLNNRCERDVSPPSRQNVEDTKVELMKTARSILELTRFINVEPYTHLAYVLPAYPFLRHCSSVQANTYVAPLLVSHLRRSSFYLTSWLTIRYTPKRRTTLLSWTLGAVILAEWTTPVKGVCPDLSHQNSFTSRANTLKNLGGGDQMIKFPGNLRR
jgi:hypothetical protein